MPAAGEDQAPGPETWESGAGGPTEPLEPEPSRPSDWVPPAAAGWGSLPPQPPYEATYAETGYGPATAPPGGYDPYGAVPGGHDPADYPPAGYPPVGYPPAGYPPAGYEPGAYPPGHVQPPGYGYYAYPVAPPTNGMAVAALVLGIVWLYWIGSILALIFGYIAKFQIDRAAGPQQGRGMAIAGIALGWVGVGFLAVFILVFVVQAT